MKTTRIEYLTFFNNWLNYQFDHSDQETHKALILEHAGKVVEDDDEAEYWSNRDCWTMYHVCNDVLRAKVMLSKVA